MRQLGARGTRGLAVLAAALLAASGMPRARAEEPTLTRLPQRLPVVAPPGAVGPVRALLDTRLRRAYQIFDLTTGLGIRAFHLDTLEELAYRAYEFEGDMYLVTVDPAGHRLLVPYDYAEAGASGFAGVKVLDGRTLEEVADWRRPVPGMGAQPELVGMSYYNPSGGRGPGKLLFLFEEQAPRQAFYGGSLVNAIWVVQWDAVNGEMDWPPYQLGACRNPYPHPGDARFTQQFFRSAGEPAIFLGCVTSDLSGIAIKLTLDDQGRPLSEDAFPGPAGVDFVLADPPGNRILFVVEKAKDESLFIFDGTRAAYVGAVGISGDPSTGVGYGLDSEAGRMYAQTGDVDGLLLLDTRRTPPAQALAFPQFHAPGDLPDILVDPAAEGRARRAFIRPGTVPFYYIYRDEIPVATDPKLSDLDAFTIDRSEQEGVTASNFEASGHAFGVRSLVVGGVEGLLPGSGDDPTLTPRKQVRNAGSPCTLFDREFAAGVIGVIPFVPGGPGVTLANNAAGSAAVAADADPGTKNDAGEPASRCWPDPDPFGTEQGLEGWPKKLDQNEDLDKTVGQVWPFEKLECSGTGEKSTKHQRLEGFLAQIKCDARGERAEGFAQARTVTGTAFAFAPDGVPVVTVAEAGSRSVLQRDRKLGVVATTEAWAKGVDVAGAGTIGLISTKAVSTAAGQKGTAHGTFEPRICGVRTPSYEQQGCTNPKAAIDALNRALGARGRARLPEPDAELLKGSPGGYQASVKKDRFEELSARVLNNDFSTQVAGLEIVLLNDSPKLGRARQIFQFAGVDASTTYGIFLLTSDVALPPIPIDEFVPTLLEPETQVLGERIEAPPLTRGPAGPLLRTIVRKVKAGMVLAARSPREAALMTVVWATLGLPLYMALRRRRLGKALEVG